MEYGSVITLRKGANCIAKAIVPPLFVAANLNNTTNVINMESEGAILFTVWL